MVVHGGSPRHLGATGGEEVSASRVGRSPAGAARARRVRARGGAQPKARRHAHPLSSSNRAGPSATGGVHAAAQGAASRTDGAPPAAAGGLAKSRGPPAHEQEESGAASARDAKRATNASAGTAGSASFANAAPQNQGCGVAPPAAEG